MAQERIKLTKKVYDKQSASDLLNRSFSEIMNPNNINNTNLSNNIKQLFTLYNDLFYEIPKIGQQSHTTLFQQSRDYIGDYIDSKDAEIESLIDKIVELEEKLSNQDQPNKEHPFFRNGTILMNRDDNSKLFYMDNGTARPIAGNISSEVFKDLKGALGYKDNDSWEDIVIQISPEVISQIEPGPQFGPEDIGSSETNVEAEIATFADSFNYNVLQDGELNPNNYPITEVTIPSNYVSMAPQTQQLVDSQINQANIANVSSYDKYREYLVNRIKIVWQSEKRFNLLTDKYNNDIEYGFTELERNKAQTLKEAVRPKLNQARETLVYYKRLWTFVKKKSANSANAKSLMLEAQTNFESILNTPVSDSERNEYGGWENGKGNFPNIDLAGLENYQADTGNLY